MTALIFTPTGKVGKVIAANMIEAGENPRLYARDAAAVKDTMPEGDYDVVEGGLYDEAAIRAAMDGVNAVFFPGLDSLASDLSYAEHIINGAKDAGVERIVFLSAFLSDAQSESPFVKMMGVIEDMIRTSGVGYTMLGAEWFMDNFFGYVQNGALSMPFGKGQNSFVAAEDIGACAAEALRNPGHANQAYIITGPETMDHYKVVEIIAEVTGRRCVYNELTVDQFREATAAIGWEEWMTDLYVDITKFMRDGMVAGTSGDVEGILGRPPLSLADFVTKHRDEFTALCEPAMAE